jgi:hypothetical protein
VTDDLHTLADDGAAPPPAVANDVRAPSAMSEPPTAGAVREEGLPGFGTVTLSNLPNAPAGEPIKIGRVDANNHSPSIGRCMSDAGLSRIGLVWIESPLGDTSGMGAVMLQRMGAGGANPADSPVDWPVDWIALALAANDNMVRVTDLTGRGAVGSSPTVAELTAGSACVAWIGADGHARGRLYPAADADGGGPDEPAYAAVNAALDDLGPVGAAPDGTRRLQVAELRPGSFAVMWLALAPGGPVLHGSMFVGPPDVEQNGHWQGGWTQHAIPDIRLPRDFAGPFSIGFAEHSGGAGFEVTCSGPAGTAIFSVDRDHAGSGAIPAAASGLPVGPSPANIASQTADTPAVPHNLANDLDMHADGRASEMQSAGAAQSAGLIVLTGAATAGENETAPDVAMIGDGFAVAWQEPGATDQARQLKVGLYDAQGVQRGADILVADDAAAGDEAAEIASLMDGLVAAYVDTGEGALVVKAYGGDGTQIGLEAIVARSDAGAIVETAIAANAADEIAVVYRQQHGGDDATADHGRIMLQRYSIATVDGSAALVELGGCGHRDEAGNATQGAGGNTGALELAIGRAPAVITVDAGFAIVWVERDGGREIVSGAVLDRNGAELCRIDLSHLLGDAGIAGGTGPTLHAAGDGGILVSWVQPDPDGGQMLMAALYRETAPGVWLAPDTAVCLKAFADAPDDYAVSVSSGAEGQTINVIWSEKTGNHEAVYSQRVDLDGRQLGDATQIAQGDASTGTPQYELDSLAVAGLPDGHVVVLARQGSEGDNDLLAHLVAAPTDETGGDGNSADSIAFTTRVGEETAINPLAEALASGLGISHINGMPITTASPVDVGFGWVQLRGDGWLTVTPDAGYRGPIEFDYAVTGAEDDQHALRHVVVDVGTDEPPAAVTLSNQITTVAEDVSTASPVKVADIAMTGGELGTDGLSLTGLDAGMFEIVGNGLYLKEGIELDFETKPILSVEIFAPHADGLEGGAAFTLSIAGAGAAALAAANDALVFAPGYGGVISYHPLIDLSASHYRTFQELMDAGALVQEGENVVITLYPDDPADLQKIVLKGAALVALGDQDLRIL